MRIGDQGRFVVVDQVLLAQIAFVVLAETFAALAGHVRRHAQGLEYLLAHLQAGVEGFANHFHAEVHQLEGVLAVARAGEHFQVRIEPAQQARGAHGGVGVVGGEHEDFGAFGMGGAQQFGFGRVAEIDHRAEAARQFDLFGIVFERGEGDLLRAQDAADDLAHAPEAGDDDARAFVVDRIGRAFLLLFGMLQQPVRNGDDHERRHRHAQADDGDEAVAQGVVDQADAKGFVEHDEGEFAAQRQHGAEHHRLAQRQAARPPADQDQDQQLGQQQSGDAGGDPPGFGRDLAEVDAHADGDEEQAEQQALERFDLRLEFVAEFGIGQQHAGEESAQAHRQAAELHQPGGTDDDQQRGRGENFGHLRPGHGAEQLPQQQATADHDQRDHAERLEHRIPGRRRLRGGLGFAEQRDQGEQRDRHEILQEQDGESEPAVAGGQLLAFGQDLQADGGR